MNGRIKQYSGHLIDNLIETVALAEQHARVVLEEFAADEIDPCECCGGIGECASNCELSIQTSRDDAESRWR